MGKNKGKGGKSRRRGKNDNDFVKQELVRRDEEGQVYAQVIRMLGGCRLMAHCFDGKERICHIRGKLRMSVWISAGDYILLGLRDYQDGKADVILKYDSDEVRVLKSEGQLSETKNEGEKATEAKVEFVALGDESEVDEVVAQNRIYEISSNEEESDEDVIIEYPF